MNKRSVFEDFARYVSRGKPAFFEAAGLDLVMGRREGPYFWDLGGRRYLDCHGNGGVYNLGHRHPAVVEALRRGLESLDIGNHHLVSEPRARLARRLADLLPAPLCRTAFASGGGEAADLAIKLARAATGRTGIICAEGGYHGHTGLALAAGHERFYRAFGPPAPGFRRVPFGDADALAAELRSGEPAAAVLLETIPATLGMVVPPPDYLARVRRSCDEAGALLVLDEVQAGLGRTGRLWAFEHWGIAPDVLVLGKGLSGGIYPIAACCYRDELDAVFQDDPFVHVSTFGGSELGCEVALAVLGITTAPGFLDAVAASGARLRAGLEAIRDRRGPAVREPRGLGLMAGLRLESPMLALALCKRLYDRGVFAVFAANDPSVVQLLPPLIAGGEQLDELLAALDAALA